MRRLSATSGGRTPTGFTLIEVLVAVGTALMLLTAVYAAIDMHWRYENAGQLEMKRGQVARAVFARLSTDIRSVQYVASDPETAVLDDSEESEDTEGTDDAEVDDSGTATSSDLSQLNSLGVIGTATRLTLHVNKPVPPRRFAVSDDDDSLFIESEQRSVTWFLADLSGGELEGMAAARFSDDPAIIAAGLIDDQADGPLGLGRADVDRLAGTISAPSDTEILMAEAAEFLAPEVVSLTFRYFDGVDWVEEWDSDLQGAVPTAIEITLGFVAPGPDDPLQAAAADAIPDTYRFVVALPVAESMVSEEAF